MANNKDTTKPTPVTVDSTQPTEVEELQKAIDSEYRTDHLTLPIVALMQDPVRDEISNREREIILNPSSDENTVVDDKGTTLKELRDQYQFGIMLKDAPEEAMKYVGKHTVTVGQDLDGNDAVLITSPNSEVEVAVSAPEVKGETNAPSGSELMYRSSPVPSSNVSESEPANKADKE